MNEELIRADERMKIVNMLIQHTWYLKRIVEPDTYTKRTWTPEEAMLKLVEEITKGKEEEIEF